MANKFDAVYDDYMADARKYLTRVKSDDRYYTQLDPNHPRFSQARDEGMTQERHEELYKKSPPILSQGSMVRSDRRYTTAELDAMEQEAVGQGMDPQAARDAVDVMSGSVEGGENFVEGFGASLKRTILGLKQAYQYLAGDDKGREEINAAIKRLEEHPALQTPAGKMGDVTGTAAQFAGPQGGASLVAKAAPKAVVKTIQAVTGKPGSVGRTALEGAAFEASQPENVSDAGTDEYLLSKTGHTVGGAVAGTAMGQIGKMATSPGIPVAPERVAVNAEANRLGFKLTPAQRTGDVTLSQFEEGLASRPGSAKVILDARAAQQDVLDKKAAEAIGIKRPKPDEAGLAEAGDAARKGYQAMASIPKMSWDTKYIEDLEKFAARQGTKATGSTNAADVAKKLRKGAGKLTGNDFLEELQGVRDMQFAAKQNRDVATSKQLGQLSEIMEDYAERRVAKLAKLGQVPADAMDQVRAARVLRAKIHAVEKATEPVSGKVSALKYLTQEFKGNKASSGPSQSPVAKGLEDVGAAARVMKQVVPYIGSSGTAERIAGQQLVDASQGFFQAVRAAGPIMKNYLAAKYYMKYGGKPGVLGNRLTPEQNLLARRLMPDVVFAGERGAE